MRRNWTAVLVVALSAVMLGSVKSFADDSAMSNVGGGMVAPMVSHPSVRMVNETVTIKLTDKGVKVHCEFLFRNEGKKCMVKMGFPERAWAYGEGSAVRRLSGFRSWVDGKPVKCIYKQGQRVRKADYGSESRDSWYIKDVPFDTGQTRTVVDEYSTELGFEDDSMSTDFENPLNFTYILRTGRNWKGPIGKAKIVVDISGVSMDHYEPVPSPKGFVFGKNTILWTLTNFEPKDDVSIDLVPRFPKLNDKMIDSHLWSPFTRVGGVTMTGPRFLEDLGADVEYPEKNGFLVIKYNGRNLKLKPGSKTASLNGSRITLQAAPSINYYPTQMPLASVIRALGGKAYYSQKEHRLLVWLKDLSKKKH